MRLGENKKNAKTLFGIQAERNKSSPFLIECLQKITSLAFRIENVFRLKEFKYFFYGPPLGMTHFISILLEIHVSKMFYF